MKIENWVEIETHVIDQCLVFFIHIKCVNEHM